MRFATIFAFAAIAVSAPGSAQTSVAIDLNGDTEVTAEDRVIMEAMAACIFDERKRLAKRYLRKEGDERLRLLLPLIAAPCQPADRSRLNVRLLEEKLQELVDAE